MRKFLVDTDILADFFHDRAYAKELLSALRKRGEIFVSILSITELRTGFTPKQAQFFIPRLYRIVHISPITIRSAELAGELRYRYQTLGRLLSTVDTLIAATAIVEECDLVTGNRKDFPMSEVKIYPLKKARAN